MAQVEEYLGGGGLKSGRMTSAVINSAAAALHPLELVRVCTIGSGLLAATPAVIRLILHVRCTSVAFASSKLGQHSRIKLLVCCSGCKFFESLNAICSVYQSKVGILNFCLMQDHVKALTMLTACARCTGAGWYWPGQMSCTCCS